MLFDLLLAVLLFVAAIKTVIRIFKRHNGK